MRKLLVLDLDGTCRASLFGEKSIQHLCVQQIVNGADKAIAHYHQEDYQIVGITNQAGVSAGHKSFAECFEEQRYTLNLIPQMTQIYFCPDFEGRECWVVSQVSPVPMSAASFGYQGTEFRKLGSGMLKLAMWQYDIAPQNSFFIGDRQEDAAVADAARVIFIWADTWRERYLCAKVQSQKAVNRVGCSGSSKRNVSWHSQSK